MRNKINDGGPAFPVSTGMGPLAANFVSSGMTLREWFAGMAMQGWLSSDTPGRDHLDYTAEAIERDAKLAYAIADAMIAHR